MNKKSWILIISGLTVSLLLICGGLFVVTMWIISNTDSTETAWNFGDGDAVAIVHVEGVIMPGDAPPVTPFGGSSSGTAYSQRVVKHLKKANADSNVKVVILYVDSPGGSVFASEEIYQQIKKMTKPVITAMGSMAASGGYYVSAPTQEIWATSSSLTCSIGVISQFLNLEGFAKQYGITEITIKSGKLKDTGNPFREFSAEDRQLWQSIIDETYDEFVRIVAEGRKMKEDEVRKIADGRVCTGKQAKAMGLVDQIGYLPQVIDRAAELGNIDGTPRLVEYTDEQTFLQALGLSTEPTTPMSQLKEFVRFHPGSPLMYLYVGP